MKTNYRIIRNCVESHFKGITPNYVDDSNTIVLNQKCIRDNRIDYLFARYVSSEQKISDLKFLRLGDLLINSTGQGTAGRCACVDKLPKDKKVVVDSHILVIRCSTSFIAKCISDTLYNNEFLIQSFLEGSSGQSELDRTRLFNLKILLPNDDNDLRNISSLSQNILDLTELNYKINAELETIAKLLYDYWFVQFNFPDKNGKPYKSSGGKMIYNEELRREIPEEWEVKTLCQLTDWSTDSLNPFDTPTKLYKYYSIPIFDKNGTYSEELGGNILSNKFIVKETDVLVSKLNPKTNRVIWAQDEKDQICSTEFVVWRTSNDKIKGFLYITAKCFSFINYCIKSASGTSHSHNRINPEIMMKYPQAYNNDIVLKYGEIINPLIHRYSETTKQNGELTKLRDWLLPMLMSGQVTVK